MRASKSLPSILSSCLGNILEWYDFGLFTIFSSLFSRIFFPTEDPHVALITTFSIFAVGFLCRPIGALIFGYLGDKYGRASTLRLSVLMISLPTLIIGILPNYQQAGVLAPILLTLTRIWQGISIGGEYSGNLIYLAETAPDKYRATFTSFAGVGANIGILLATLVGASISTYFSDAILDAYGWRIAYVVSGLFCLAIYSFRLRIKETHIFDYLKEKKLLVNNPIEIALHRNLPQLFRTIGLVCFGATYYYFCFVYLPIYFAQKLHWSVHQISFLMSLLICIMIILVPIAGFLCDKIGRRKMLLFNAFFVTLWVVPGYYLLQFNQIIILIAVMGTFVLASSSEQGTTCIAVVENFPPPARYTGLSLGYNLGNGILGGTVPMVCEWLLTYTHSPLSPAFYIAFCALITGLVVYFFVPETHSIDLTQTDELNIAQSAIE